MDRVVCFVNTYSIRCILIYSVDSIIQNSNNQGLNGPIYTRDG